MHESLTTEAQQAKLTSDVDAFFEKHRGHVVTIDFTVDYFKSNGHTLTRPIWVTLQCFGCIVRPIDGVEWPMPMRAGAWIYDHTNARLRPADVVPR